MPGAPPSSANGCKVPDVQDIALVDDDELYREALTADLADRGFSVSGFADGPSFLDALNNGVEARVALLDWSLPEMSGFELFGALRERGIGLPVVFLTGHSFVERELQAFAHGAVDFIDKDRGIAVLAHRLRVLIDSQHKLNAVTTPETQRHGNLTLYPSTARAEWRLQDVGLTMTEYKVLVFLISHKDEPLTYRAIYDAAHYAGFIAGSGPRGYQTNVRSLIKRIRRKFSAVDTGFSEIKNVPDVGYIWRDPQSSP